MRQTAISPADDRALAEALQVRGDERAFRELYRRHTPALYQLTLRVLGGSDADAQDVIQETWIRATTKLDGFRWESSLRTWLTGIALNLSREVLRRRARRPTVEWSEVHEPAIAPPRLGDRMDLERAIATLPPGSRTVLVLHDIEGFTHEEIANRLGVSIGTSKSQLFAARRALRVRLTRVEEIPNA
ncbi:MAG: sigma-70 family RNA polymerase sigma factor [Candidatus Eisenbacteria bacterium]|uniref:Sigma-70 family RNA polymerase sigma factor n=1 Tax=Eiseniibacteriota bacterium TaxID=2212470 RepID=A0A849SE86_UNCEI|nr:sigma-70 family RNA polymerase sigma factor [Candidatus Eisenbacteria bacterium]